MAVTVDDMILKLQKAHDDIPNVVKKITLSNSSKIIELNRSLQLFQKGIDSEGNKLIPYLETTKLIKRDKNQIFKHTTLKDTGMFYNGFRVIVENNLLYITSTDDKTDELMNKYGKNIFGLTRDNRMTLFDEIIRPDLCDYLNKLI